MGGVLRARRRIGAHARRDPSTGIVSAFSSLIAAQAVAALLGYLFWVVAARGLPTTEIAAAYAAVAAMTLIGNLAMLGYGTLLLGELPCQSPGQQRSTLLNAVAVVGLTGAVLGVGWVIIGRHLGHTFEHAVRDPLSGALFALGVSGTAVGLVLDQAVLGLGRPTIQVTRNLIASSLKFPLVLLLVVTGTQTHLAVLLAWVLPLTLSTIVLWRRLRLPHEETESESLRAHIRRYTAPALLNHALNLSLAASSLFLPMIAAGLLTTHDYAGFSLAWLVATFVFIPPFMLAVALFATSVGDFETYRAQARRTLPAGLAVGACCYLGAALLAKPIMFTFGSAYATEGSDILRIVALGVMALVVKDHFFALYRVQERMGFAAMIALAGLAAELAGASIGGVLDGASGLCLGWLTALYAQALLMAPVVLRSLRTARVELVAT